METAMSVQATLVELTEQLQTIAVELDPIRHRVLRTDHKPTVERLHAAAVSIKRLAQILLRNTEGVGVDEGRGRRRLNAVDGQERHEDRLPADPMDYRERRSGDVMNE
jgi:hypothetical protein